jgi:hypothetical protein
MRAVVGLASKSASPDVEGHVRGSDSPMKEPLLGPLLSLEDGGYDNYDDGGFGSRKRRADRASNVDAAAVKNLDPATLQKGRIYANNKPRIILETLSARSALIILIITYVVFIIGFIIDAYNITNGFSNSNVNLGSNLCSSESVTTSNFTTSRSWGCLDGNTWKSTVVGLTNVISIQLNVKQSNFSGLFNSTSQGTKSLFLT